MKLEIWRMRSSKELTKVVIRDALLVACHVYNLMDKRRLRPTPNQHHPSDALARITCYLLFT